MGKARGNTSKKLEEKEKRKEQMKKQNYEGVVVDDPAVVTLEQKATIIDSVGKDVAEDIKRKASANEKKRVLVTTSRKATRKTVRFAGLVAGVIPDSVYAARDRSQETAELVKASSEYTHIVLVGENSKKTDRLSVMCLPDGPTAYFRIVTIDRPPKAQKRLGSRPEVFVTNFTTQLGDATSTVLKSLFGEPDLKKKRSVVFHNQRDFVFFRSYKYSLREKARGVSLQEDGFRFTLRLLCLQNELGPRTIQPVWTRREHKQDKKTFFL
ncbi:MAG: brix domain-containing protein [Amphiamblys sp. WSBS2006]|nr:MAG: brix domain-containing protein [Amphiamblys sp. WSBS2006]